MKMLNGRKLKPETAEEVKEVETLDGMRRRIHEYKREDSMVQNILNSAYYRGLSGDDTMTLLAYHALLDRERFRDLAFGQINLNPAPTMIVQDKV